MFIRDIISNNKNIIGNFSYISALQIFILFAPIITYPYLTKVLGKELYGVVITAQVLAGYATILVKFGFDSVSARHVSIYRDDKDKLSEILSSILSMRFVLWLFSLSIYCSIVFLVPSFRQHRLLFVCSFGLTINSLLFPQFFFQGIEKMKYIALINLLIQSIFLCLIFVVIKKPADYYKVPILHTLGYLAGGGTALFVITKKYGIRFKKPTKKHCCYYFKDALPLFVTDAICSIKDKLNYILLGSFVGMGEVVVYDIGSKLTSLAVQPLTILSTVTFPKMAKNRSNKLFFRVGLAIFISVLAIVLLIEIFLPIITNFLIGGDDVPLLPIRLFLFSPIFLAIGSFIGSNFLIARGYNRYLLYSIIVTTTVYLFVLLMMLLAKKLNTVTAFISLTVISYFVEMTYRSIVAMKVIKSSTKL